VREAQAVAAGLDLARSAGLAIHAEAIAQRLDRMTVQAQRLAYRQLVTFDGGEI
jgi:hypothetical protein